jgi:hypothetical protein
MATYLPNITDVIPEPALFTPNFSFIDTMLRRRQGLYEQGFAQVNNAYNFVNRNVSHAYSSKVRDEFLKQANQNLKNLSSLDLSQQQNVKAAASVFEPFVKNRLVLGDMAFTAHLDQQESIGESFRLKDGGKEYSEDNMTYLRQQRQAFANDDISNVGKYYANRRSFTPYYDWNKEMQEAMKNFKPSSTKIERPNGMFMVTEKNASYTKEEINKYLNATLSDKAKQQMRIEAAVKYPDLNSVAGLYVNQATKDLPQIEGRLEMINNSIKSEKNTSTLESLKEERDFYSDRAREIRSNIESIQNGDVSFLKNNAQRLAENIYMGQAVARLADGFSHLDIEQTIGFNQVAMMYARMAFDREENKKTRDKDEETFDPVFIQRPAAQVATSLSELDANIVKAESNVKNKFDQLKSVMIQIEPAFTGKTIGDITQEDVDSYIEKNPDNKQVIDFVEANRDLDLDKNQKENFTLGAEQYAKEKMGNDMKIIDEYNEFITNNFNTYKPKIEWDPVRQTYMKTVLIETGANAGNEIKVSVGKYYYEGSPQGSGRAYDERIGRERASEAAALKVGKSKEAVEKLINQYEGYKSDYNSERNTNTSIFTPGLIYSVDDARNKKATGYIEAVTGLKDKVSLTGFFPSSTGFSVDFKLDDANATNPVDRTILLNDLTAKLKGTVTYDEKRDVFSVTNALNAAASPYLDPYYGIPTRDRRILAENDGFTGRTGTSRPGTNFNIGDNKNYTFQIKKLFGDTPETNSYILLVNNIPIKQTYGSALEAYSIAIAGIDNPEALDRLLK